LGFTSLSIEKELMLQCINRSSSILELQEAAIFTESVNGIGGLSEFTQLNEIVCIGANIRIE
jgi:hypothetical protein